jgi:hypothetical protein
MADKDFGVKRISLIGASGTPTITSPNNLNINANTVAISTNISIGGQVNSDLKIGSSFFVGIGSTVPTVKLDVIGDGKFTGNINASSILGTGLNISGLGTIINFSATSGIVTNITGVAATITNLKVTSGIVTNLTGVAATITNLNVTSGIVTNLTGIAGTITNLTVTSGIVTNLTGIAATITNLNVTSGIITNITGIAGTITDLNVTSGIITNITGVAGTITNLNVTSGIVTNLTGIAGTITNLTVTSGIVTNLTGIAGTITNLNVTSGIVTNISVSGISTLGVTSTTDLTVQKLNVSGISTFGGFDGVLIKSENGLGIVTSANMGVGTVFYYGDGSQLTGIGTAAQAQTVSIEVDLSDQTTSIIFATDPTVSIAATLKTNPNLVFNASGSRLGIGTTNPITTVSIGGTLSFTNNNIRIGDNTTGCSITSGVHNFFAGSGAGRYNTTGKWNNFFGESAGYYNTTGCYNNFFGKEAGKGQSGQSSGKHNNIFGAGAGKTITSGSYNNFFGFGAGENATTGKYNNFFGMWAGINVVTGRYNNFFGKHSGANSNGWHNSFFGTRSGCTQTAGDRNIAIGFEVQLPDTTGSDQLKIGSGTNSWIIGNSLFNVGIGSTNPSSKLFVEGDGYFTGIVTSSGFYVNGALIGGGSITGADIVGTGLSISGIGTIGAFNISSSTIRANNSGIITFYGDINGSPVAQGNSVGVALTAENVIGGIASVTQLHVSGISTLGITSTTSLTSEQLNVSGITTLGVTSTTDLTSQKLNVTGIATIGVGSTGILINGITGIISSSNPGITTVVYYGDGSNLTGNIPSIISNIDTNQTYYPLLSQNNSGTISSISVSSNSIVFNPALSYLGIGTTNPTTNLDVFGSIKASNNLSVSGIATVGVGSTGILIDGILGIITSASPGITTVVYYGDGSKLTGIGTAASAQSVALSTNTSSTNASIVFSQTPDANPTSTLNSNPNLIFNASTSSLGIGTTNPTSKLWVDGSGYFIGSVTSANGFYVNGALIGSGTISGSDIAGTSLNITGIATLGTVKISSGTIQATTGIITYYGDGSQLTNLTASIGDLYELDDISSATNNDANTFVPTYNYNTVLITNPFRLLITINGVLQSAHIHNIEYVWNNNLLCTNDGYTIDYDGYIKFTESLPVGTQVVIKTTVGSNTILPRIYPFKALDIMF